MSPGAGLAARSASSRVSAVARSSVDELALDGLPERVGRAFEIAGRLPALNELQRRPGGVPPALGVRAATSASLSSSGSTRADSPSATARSTASRASATVTRAWPPAAPGSRAAGARRPTGGRCARRAGRIFTSSPWGSPASSTSADARSRFGALLQRGAQLGHAGVARRGARQLEGGGAVQRLRRPPRRGRRGGELLEAAPRSDRTPPRRRASRRAVRARSGRRATRARPPRRGGAAPGRAHRRRSRARRSRRPAGAGSPRRPSRSCGAAARPAPAADRRALRPCPPHVRPSSGSWSSSRSGAPSTAISWASKASARRPCPRRLSASSA